MENNMNYENYNYMRLEQSDYYKVIEVEKSIKKAVANYFNNISNEVHKFVLLEDINQFKDYPMVAQTLPWDGNIDKFLENMKKLFTLREGECNCIYIGMFFVYRHTEGDIMFQCTQ